MSNSSISKSKFIAGRQCLKREWLQIYNRAAAAISDDFAVQGSEVGALAQTAFPGGVLIQADNRDFNAALAETARAMADPDILAIYEAAFQVDRLRIRVDILVRMADGWNVGSIQDKEQDFLASEVKSSNSVKTHQIEDLSFQVYVLTKVGLKVREATVMHLNGDYRYPGGEHDLTKLFKMEVVRLKDTAWVEAELAKQLPIIDQPLAPVIATGKQCNNPYHCEFWATCHAASTTAFVPPAPNFTDAAVSMLEKLEWPLFFLDFESIVPAVPLYVGMKPWQQVLTQWSCHIQQVPGGPIEHKQFLHDNPSDPREPLLTALLETLGQEGSVLIYSKYERTQLRGLAKMLSEFQGAISRLETRYFDLLDLLRLCYDADDFGGSLSLKKTIKLVPEMKYDGLAIANGNDAAAAWRRLITLPDGSEKNEIRENLAAYCAIDTVAMVLILREIFGATSLTARASAS